MPAPVAGINGAWQCTACPNVNFATRDACNRCAAPKPAEQPPSQQARGGAPVAGENGNWQCSSCQNVNFPMREVCNRCHAPKPQGMYDAAPQPVQGAGRAPVAGEGGNWACTSCGNVNFPMREFCNLCQAPKVQSAASANTSRPAGTWSCHACQNVNTAICNRCQTPQLEANWEELEELRNLLAERDSQLRERDHRIKTLEAALDQQLLQQEVADFGGGAAGGHKGGAPVAGVDGNWQCPSCQNVNFPARDACNRCHLPRPAPQAPNGAPVAGVKGNWQCSLCGNVNFAVRDSCNRCAAPRFKAELPPASGYGVGKAGGKGKAPVPGEDGNWVCNECSNVNYAMRDLCNRCQAPKPTEEFTEADQSLMEQLLQPAKRARY